MSFSLPIVSATNGTAQNFAETFKLERLLMSVSILVTCRKTAHVTASFNPAKLVFVMGFSQPG